MTPDLTLSISDSSKTYEAYASEPSNQIVGKDFDQDVFDKLASDGMHGDGIINRPGRYGVRAHYAEKLSNWVEIDVAP